VEVTVQFRVTDLDAFVRTVEDPPALTRAMAQRDELAGRENVDWNEIELVDPCPLLSAIADRAVNAYLGSHDIDTLLGQGRLAIGSALRQQIQASTDAAGLGVEIVFVGVSGIHPPQQQEVALAFQEQIGAVQEKQGLIEEALKESIQTLAKVAGSREKAREIDAAIERLRQLKEQVEALPADGRQREAKAREVVEQEARVEQLIAGARGEAAQQLYAARGYRWQKAVNERAKADRFRAELMAYEAAPRYYPMKRYLDAVAEGLGQGQRKIILAAGQLDASTMRIDLKDAANQLDVFLSEEP
jgi:regulator of protease activity HflC (stomatin/prohibitin superfamily)